MESEEAVVFLVGAGAVEGAWAPVLRAVREVIWSGTPSDPDLANLQMARLVYLLRMVDETNADARRELKAALSALRVAIARELSAAATKGGMRARPHFSELLRRFHPGQGGQIAVLTTNWDLTVAEATKAVDAKVDALHLHGSVRDANSLYLPTELSTEPYREAGESHYHAQVTGLAINTIEEATQLVIYGLSLSPLDAELAQVISFAKERKNLRRAHVIDLDPEPVARRLGVLLEDSWPADGIHCERPVGPPWELQRFRLMTSAD